MWYPLASEPHIPAEGPSLVRLACSAPSPDGQEFLVAVPEGAGVTEILQLVVSWPSLIE